MLKTILEFIKANNILEIAALVASVAGLIWAIYSKTKLDRKRIAIDMIKGWNRNTAKDSDIIRKAFREKYETCEKIETNDVEKILNINKHGSINGDEEKTRKLKTAISQLFNYFEFIASAYRNKAADRKIILDSFSGTMFRYYIILENYLLIEFENAKRNHWKPYTFFIKELIDRGDIDCNNCKDKRCLNKDRKTLLKNLSKINR